MTIDSRTGNVILRDSIKDRQEFKGVDGIRINHTYFENERRHYLKWHNELFIQNKQSH